MDKQLKINLYTLELINENIRLYQDNIRLNHEVKRLRKRLMEHEGLEIKNSVTTKVKDDYGPVVVFVLKRGGEFIN